MKRHYHIGNDQWGYRLFLIQTGTGEDGLRIGIVDADEWRVIVEPKYRFLSIMGNYARGNLYDIIRTKPPKSPKEVYDDYYIILETGETFNHRQYPKIKDRLKDMEEEPSGKFDFIADFFYIPIDDPELPVSTSPDDWSTVGDDGVRRLKMED